MATLNVKPAPQMHTDIVRMLPYAYGPDLTCCSVAARVCRPKHLGFYGGAKISDNGAGNERAHERLGTHSGDKTELGLIVEAVSIRQRWLRPVLDKNVEIDGQRS